MLTLKDLELADCQILKSTISLKECKISFVFIRYFMFLKIAM